MDNNQFYFICSLNKIFTYMSIYNCSSINQKLILFFKIYRRILCVYYNKVLVFYILLKITSITKSFDVISYERVKYVFQISKRFSKLLIFFIKFQRYFFLLLMNKRIDQNFGPINLQVLTD